MSKIYAFIPARAGSKRIANKNTQLFHGKSLAHWTLKFAKECGVFDEIYLSTDISELIESVESSVNVIDRPKNLSGDKSTLLEVINDAACSQNFPHDAILVLLQVTAPLRVKSDLTEGLRAFKQYGRSRSIVSVSQSLYPIELHWRITGDKLIPIDDSDDPKFTRKQNHAESFTWNDIVIIDSIKSWTSKRKNLYGNNPAPLLIPPERSMPIDYPVQFKLAEALFPPVDERKVEE